MRGLLILAFLLGANSGAAFAEQLQEPIQGRPLPPPPHLAPTASPSSCAMRLTLDQALVLAEGSNPDLRVTGQSIEVAKDAIIIAGQRPNPNVALGVPIGPAERKQRVAFNVPLETGGRRQARLEVADAGVREAELTQLQARLVVLNQTRLAFIELAIAQATLEQSRRDLEFFDRLVQVATQRFKAGDIAEADVIRARFEREQLQRTLYPADNRVRIALLALNRLIGQPLETEVEVVDDGLLFPDLLSLEGAEWSLPELPALQQMALNNRPDLALSAQQIQSAKLRTVLAKANQSPDLSLQGTLLYDPTYPAFAYQVGVQIEIPWGSDRGGEVAQARAREQEAALRQQAALATAEQAVATAYNNFQAARRQLAHDLRVLRPQAEQVLDLAERVYALGEGDITEVLLAGQSVQRQRQLFLADVAQLHLALGQLQLAVNSNFPGGTP